MTSRKEQKKKAQKQLSAKRKDADFIAEYIKRTDPETYTKAESFLTELRRKYPTKRDLTATHEFLVKTTSYTSYNQYYRRKKTSTTTTSTTTVANTLELNIQLLPKDVVSENTTQLQTMPEETYESLVREITKDPLLRAVFDDMNSTMVEDDMFSTELVHETIEETSPLEKELMKL